MTTKKKKEIVTKEKIIWRWSLFTAVLAFLIIGCIGVYNGNLDPGSINKIYAVSIKNDYVFWSPIVELRFSISRWWDVLFGPLLITTCVLFWPKGHKEENFWSATREVSAISFAIGYCLAGIPLGIINGVFFGITFVIVLDLFYTLCILAWELLKPLIGWLFFYKF